MWEDAWGSKSNAPLSHHSWKNKVHHEDTRDTFLRKFLTTVGSFYSECVLGIWPPPRMSEGIWWLWGEVAVPVPDRTCPGHIALTLLQQPWTSLFHVRPESIRRRTVGGGPGGSVWGSIRGDGELREILLQRWLTSCNNWAWSLIYA